MFLPISECCIQGSVLPGEPRGSMQPTGPGISVNRYYTRPAELKHPKVCLVLLYDVFGFSVPNPKLLADTYAEKLGIEVYAPDYIPSPMPESILAPAIEFYPGEKDNQSWLGWVGGKLGMLRALPYLPGILGCTPLVDKAVDDLRGKYDVIGAVGYCRGGTMVTHLLAREDCPIDAGVAFHPEWKPDEYPRFKKPSRFLLSEKDPYISPEKVEELKELFADDHAPFSVEVFKGTVHGFASRPAFAYEPTMKAFHAANEDAVSWLARQLGL